MQEAIGIPLNCGNLSSSGIWNYIKPKFSEQIKFLATGKYRPVFAASSGIVTNKDTVNYVITSSSGIKDFDIDIIYKPSGIIANIASVVSSNTSIASNGINSVSGISSGNVLLNIQTFNGYNDSIYIDVNYLPIGSTINQETFISYVNGSLSKHISDNVDTRIATSNPSVTQPVYSVQNHNDGIYVRNNNFLFSNVDFTCASPWNSYGGVNRAGVLISPRHMLFAAHYPILIGSTVRFVTQNNVLVTRTISNTLTHPQYNSPYTYNNDIQIALLDSDVPNTINFCQILPINYGKYLPSLKRNTEIPIIIIDQSELISISNLYQLDLQAKSIGQDLSSPRRAFYRELYTGDSGSPAFLIINNIPIIIFVATYGFGGSGAFVTLQKDAINTMMSQLGGGYQLTEINLSSFSSY